MGTPVIGRVVIEEDGPTYTKGPIRPRGDGIYISKNGVYIAWVHGSDMMVSGHGLGINVYNRHNTDDGIWAGEYWRKINGKVTLQILPD
jgi:hypothetical protein